MLLKFIKRAKKAKRGFTLIELIVVIAILAILAAVLVPVIGNNITLAKTNASKSDANAFFEAATLYQSNTESTGAANPFGDTIDVSSMTATPLSTMFASTYFATMPTSKFTAVELKTDATGSITFVSITDGNGAATYP